MKMRFKEHKVKLFLNLVRFQHQLTELTKLQRVMAPIMEKLTQGLGFGGMGGMGMDMGMDMGMGGMDMGMGGMPSMEQL